MGIGISVILFSIAKKGNLGNREKSRIELSDLTGTNVEKHTTNGPSKVILSDDSCANSPITSRWGAMTIKRAKMPWKEKNISPTKNSFFSKKHPPATPKSLRCWGWGIFLGAQPPPKKTPSRTISVFFGFQPKTRSVDDIPWKWFRPRLRVVHSWCWTGC